jgi:arsenate reductase
MKKLLFLCTGNSCRSQMAEGLCNYYWGNLIDCYSAGIEKHGLNPFALIVMKELDIDISHHKSKTLDDLNMSNFDYVITVCGDADKKCPTFFNSSIIIHKGFDDPPKLAKNLKNNEEILFHYRKIRDEIKNYILTLRDNLNF